jgi:hypothetical protein
MNKIIKNTSAFFLLLAGLAIILHSIIPHDHHLAESCISQNDSCPLSGNNTDNHGVNPSGSPVHCHAFNDLVSEKANTNNFSTLTKKSDISAGNVIDQIAPDSEYISTIIVDQQRSLPDSHYLELSSLRAPPSLI